MPGVAELTRWRVWVAGAALAIASLAAGAQSTHVDADSGVGPQLEHGAGLDYEPRYVPGNVSDYLPSCFEAAATLTECVKVVDDEVIPVGQ